MVTYLPSYLDFSVEYETTVACMHAGTMRACSIDQIGRIYSVKDRYIAFLID